MYRKNHCAELISYQSLPGEIPVNSSLDQHHIYIITGLHAQEADTLDMRLKDEQVLDVKTQTEILNQIMEYKENRIKERNDLTATQEGTPGSTRN